QFKSTGVKSSHFRRLLHNCRAVAPLSLKREVTCDVAKA
uniref:Uncharacterized protein n=1 Tax=Ciona savignyi TaxID=51511 RepID=H2YMG3_CIOSA